MFRYLYRYLSGYHPIHSYTNPIRSLNLCPILPCTCPVSRPCPVPVPCLSRTCPVPIEATPNLLYMKHMSTESVPSGTCIALSVTRPVPFPIEATPNPLNLVYNDLNLSRHCPVSVPSVTRPDRGNPLPFKLSVQSPFSVPSLSRPCPVRNLTPKS